MRANAALRRARPLRAAALGLFALALLDGCSSQPRRFPLADALWEDRDRNHVPKKPDEYFSGLIADGADKMVLRPLARAFSMPLRREADNVNALDEVPNSSWFTNRIGMFSITPEQAARGACNGSPSIDTTGPWTVVAAKPNGANPGFFIETKTGRYLLKVDGQMQPQRATTADVIGSKIYWTAGYWVPCNEVVYFRREILKISPDAKTTTDAGDKRPISQADVNTVLDAAFRLKSGLLRASVSRLLPGKPIGPFRYQGTRGDDPNDVIPHQHRRELRASRILAAWINHHDAREQNSLDIWVERGGRSYVRHYLLDFGDSFGGRWEHDPASRRVGFSYLFDVTDIGVDFFTLGLLPRAWYRVEMPKETELFGYYGWKYFVASTWKNDYPNPAFIEMTYRDALWMTRIIARFSDAHIRAIVEQAKLTDKRAEHYLIRALIKRRDKILAEYLTKYAPLDRFILVRRQPGKLAQSVCFQDAAIEAGIVDYREVLYKMRFYGGRRLDHELGWLQFRPDPDHPRRSCIQLPIGDTRPAELAPPGARDDHPLRYGVLKIWINQKPRVPPTSSIHLHFYDLGPRRGYRLVGIERPPKPVIPVNY